jgi:predicted AlkP superfamily pyrophosphatase or phosphodiesterase
MLRPFRFVALALLLLLSACAGLGPPTSSSQIAASKAKLTVLVSIDGFRPDYMARGETPTLDVLAAEGARGAMRPSFPSLTFPNHYALVTGRRPDETGVVANTMEDPKIPGVTFTTSTLDAVADRRWWDGGTPFWVDAEREGMRTAAMFWPGSVAPIQGVRPSRWRAYDKAMTSEQRAEALLAFIDEPGLNPGFAALYLDIVDIEGHHHGVRSAEVDAAIREADRAVARLIAGLKARGRYETTNLIVVSDHGMVDQPLDRVIVLDRLVDASKFKTVGDGALAGIQPVAGAEEEVARALTRPQEHMTCWRKADIPARYHYGRNRRVPAVVCMAEPGWTVMTAAKFAKRTDIGGHGHDPSDPSMTAVFLAHGPAFKTGVTVPLFDNVDVYSLLKQVTGVKGHKGDGNLKTLRGALR